MVPAVPVAWRSRGGPRAALVCLGLVLGLVLVELGLRVQAARTEAREQAAWRALGATPHDGPGPVPLARLIRPHAAPDIVYELIPNLAVDFAGQRVTTNADGWRGPAHPREPTPGAVRIVGLGDSVMFGWGVADGQCFLQQLSRRLESRCPGVRFEAVNTAVPGYNTVMEVATLVRKGLAWRPDLVVIDYVGNDYSLPNFIAPQGRAWSLSRCLVLDALRAAFGTGSRRRRALVPAPMHDQFQFEFDPERVPAAYRDMVGLGRWRAAMRELAELGRRHGFEVVVSTHLRAPEELVETCAELGFPLVEMQPRLEQALAERGVSDRHAAGLTVGRADPHPSALAHELQAEELERCLVETGLLRRLLARSAER